MASNPPFQLEDQTDADFFDKLVNDDDDDDFRITPSLAPNLEDGNDSDEANAFANLTVGDVGTGFEDSVTEEEGEVVNEEREAPILRDFNGKPIDATVTADGGSLSMSNEFGVDGSTEPNDGMIGAEVTSDSTDRNSGGSGVSGVKQLQWSAFNADTGQNDSTGFGSYSDFFTEIGDDSFDKIGAGDDLKNESKFVSGSEVGNSAFEENVSEVMHQFQEGQVVSTSMEQSLDGVDPNSTQYWEKLYPGWKYDVNTGQWYQVNGENSADAKLQGEFDMNSATDWAVSNERSEVSYLQQASQSVVRAIAEKGTTESVSSWNPVLQDTDLIESSSNWDQSSQENNGYPSHMVFDPQYPGWYYDMIAQEWRSVDLYNAESTVQSQDQLNQNGFASTVPFREDQKSYGEYAQVDKYVTGSQVQDYDWNESLSNSRVNHQGVNMWQQPDIAAKNVDTSEYGGNKTALNHHIENSSTSNINQQKSYDYGASSASYDASSRSQVFVPDVSFSRTFSRPVSKENEFMNIQNGYYTNQNVSSYSQLPVQSGQQFSYASAVGRSSAGRPPHTVITFGFGGKLIVIKDSASAGNSSFGSQDPKERSMSMLNLTEVVTEGTDDYFQTLCQQSFPGPLTGGNVGSKELNKWIDERIAHCESPYVDYRRGVVLKLLLSLLKIASHHYGKFRSPFGTDMVSKESDTPELAVAKLFAAAKKNNTQFAEYGAFVRCLQKLPSEGQLLATGAEVQTLLVSGRKKEALQCAQEGQLWGPALVLAAQLGDEFYVDTVKQMALRQLVVGSPLRTLCLLIAGQPADVFSPDITGANDISGAVNMSQQTAQAQITANGVIDDWEDNLAVITANRTKDDELVLIHLGDCLYKERSDIIAAHICYLVAEANFEPYSDSTRICLVGADHWKCPRTYASPEAIQRTEVFEYSKLLGNSQFTLLPFQPYKVLYAHMLAEVGRLSDSLKYCQAISKSLKTGRAPEVEAWRQLVSSLEDRIRTHQQGGFSTNLAPAKLVGKLLNLFDSTAHRVVGGLPPPIPSSLSGGVQGHEHHQQFVGPKVSTSQSTMAMSSLIPSASMEPINVWTADSSGRKIMHNRSVSEPDFGRTPRQVDSSKESSSANSKGNPSGGTSRFGRFGFGSQLLQKTVGLVLKPRQDKQAKLGETNKFYYDEKLKRWVEEGAEPPAEETTLPPPPVTATFQNGTSDYSLKSALKSEESHSNGSPEFKSPTSVERSSGIPPIPSTSNQFSVRGRMGVRARYVDTFNQGGASSTGASSTGFFQSPSAPSVKPATTGNPKFFVPSPVPSTEQPLETSTNNTQDTAATCENNPTTSTLHDYPSFQSPPHPSPTTMQRFGSMDSISKSGQLASTSSPISFHSRRVASWSGSFGEGFSPPSTSELKPLGEVLGMPSSAFMPGKLGVMHPSASFSDDLHEVEL